MKKNALLINKKLKFVDKWWIVGLGIEQMLPMLYKNILQLEKKVNYMAVAMFTFKDF